jgi:hypothetical protein
MRAEVSEMKEFIIKKQYASIYEIKNLDANNENMVRVYCSQFDHEDDKCIFNFQIRTFKPISNKGVKKNMIANVTMSISEIEQLLEYAKKIKNAE